MMWNIWNATPVMPLIEIAALIRQCLQRRLPDRAALRYQVNAKGSSAVTRGPRKSSTCSSTRRAQRSRARASRARPKAAQATW
jgi:hypothetical protein